MVEPVQNHKQEFTHHEVIDDLQPEPVRSPKARKSRVVKSSAVPTFGNDTEILNHMEKLAQAEAKKTTRTRKKKWENHN